MGASHRMVAASDELSQQGDEAYVLTVGADGYVRGVAHTDRAPLSSVIRLYGDIAEVVQRLDDLADAIAGVDVGEATDVNELRARMTALVHRVDRLEHSATSDDLADIMDIRDTGSR